MIPPQHVVAVHGVGQHRPVPPDIAADDLARKLHEALIKGLHRQQSAARTIELRAAYYAHLLRNPGEQDALASTALTTDEVAILNLWALAYGVPAEVPQGMAGKPLRLICDWVAHHVGRGDDVSFRRRLARFLSNFVRDAVRYFNHPNRRAAACLEVARVVAEHRPQVVIAHSLGSVVTYETFWAHPDVRVELLITVGSPLALPGAIFDRLQPVPVPTARDGYGTCPPNVGLWINISDHGDVIAIPRPLHARFRGLRPEDDHETSIGPVAIHSFADYLRNDRTISVLTHRLTEV